MFETLEWAERRPSSGAPSTFFDGYDPVRFGRRVHPVLGGCTLQACSSAAPPSSLPRCFPGGLPPRGSRCLNARWTGRFTPPAAASNTARQGTLDTAQ